MTFLYPLGLLGLIGVPVIILVYVLKNKYVEHIIASTYIWNLSEKFLRRRNPFAKIAGIISLILQLLLVVVISLSIAHPTFELKGEAHNYTFVIDGSGSMNSVEDGVARFKRAKDEVESVISDSVKGSKYSCVYVTDKTTVVFEGEGDKERALKMLDDITPSDAVADLTDAIGIAQGYFNSDPSAIVYLVTDKDYSSANNVTVVNVAKPENNVALVDVTIPDSLDLSVRGSLLSYLDDSSVTLGVYVDDIAAPIATSTVTLTEGVPMPFSIPLDLDTYFSISVRILEEDTLAADNEVVLYSSRGSDKFDALVVSELPFFITAAIRSTSTLDIVECRPEDYSGQRGYDLYIFDSYTPYELPSDGAVWIINPVVSTAGSGFSVQGKYIPDEAVEVEYSTSTNTQVEKLLSGVSGAPIHVTEYVRCGVYDVSFQTLMSHKGNPLIFTGVNSYGNREAVFAFDLHESDIVGYTDWIALVGNLIEFSFPTVIEKTDYVAGDTAYVNVISGCNSIVATSPSGKVTSLSTSGTVAELVLSETGIYKIECVINGNSKEFFIFSAFPEEERAPLQVGTDFSLSGEAKEGGIDGIYDNIALLFILLTVVFIADWAVYCYEKYQLR